MPLTVNDAARARDIKTFDGALPQAWVDLVYQRTGVYPVGHVVWCYDDTPDGPIWNGYPMAVTHEGDQLLGLLALRLC